MINLDTRELKCQTANKETMDGTVLRYIHTAEESVKEKIKTKRKQSQSHKGKISKSKIVEDDTIWYVRTEQATNKLEPSELTHSRSMKNENWYVDDKKNK